jgi:hypothetical protein
MWFTPTKTTKEMRKESGGSSWVRDKKCAVKANGRLTLARLPRHA